MEFQTTHENWRKFGVKMFGIGWDIMGCHEQNRVSVIDAKVSFYTQNNHFEQKIEPSKWTISTPTAEPDKIRLIDIILLR